KTKTTSGSIGEALWGQAAPAAPRRRDEVPASPLPGLGGPGHRQPVPAAAAGGQGSAGIFPQPQQRAVLLQGAGGGRGCRAGRPLGDVCPAARQPGADGLWEEGTAAAELQDPGEPAVTRPCPALPSCHAMRKPTCLACYKFDSSDVPKVLDKYQNCGPSHHLAVKVSCPPGTGTCPRRLPGPLWCRGGCQPVCSAPQEIKHRDEAECRAVEEAGKSVDVLYLPGMYAFSKGLPA
uniref:Retinoic acid receptor responder 2 n=1 Tax=Aquila chrysaetos chrysaetos TaxID=223781 RepID=A0A663FGP1_AQUCH